MGNERRAFFEQYRDSFSWYEPQDYAYYGVIPVEPSLIEAIQQAAQAVWQVLLSAGSVMQGFSDEQLLAYGYFPETFDLLRSTAQPPFIARCDFAVTPEGIYLLECNAEVATFIVETFKMNGLVARHFGYDDPNAHSEQILRDGLNDYLKLAAAAIGKDLENCNVIFAAIGDAPEDVGTAEYLASLSQHPAWFCPIESISMDETAAYDDEDEPIDILYRVYPTEWMIEDRDPQTGDSLWAALEPLVFDRKLALINPVNCMVLQNKALLALSTELYGQQNDSALSQTVQRHFLPTYMTPDALKPPYVAKPTFGREGSEVEIVKGTEQATLFNPAPEYAVFPKVYQQYVEMPVLELEGKTYSQQFSCFLVNGQPTGVAVRVGDLVINNLAKFVPIGYPKILG
ncbi:glutathionylspermidine synthase family protein [Alkalinema sp. FACHB-956]|uniref:glutathionylspermidine synthase family protein n=1 Tax=Alkalinema sp. FACHB-956 TaxID=2692768 RepID=UPI001685603B|nr:glutathionylspermidine synthase family protein [Alkalinema sp. FACHB-956]MBD2329653.1 glutathionylspermidine synthase family protein [Alkalinema sp. FACHB-956]